MQDYHDFDTTHAFEYAGLAVTAPPGNLVRIHHSVGRPEIGIHIGGTGNVVTLEAGCNVRGWVHLSGCNNRVVLGGGAGPQNLQATLYDDDTLVWGNDCTAYGVRVWVNGGRVCEIGDGCLFSEGIQIRTTDHHSIIDLETLEAINAPADVRIGRRVWVGEGVSIGKGVTVGKGAIIGTRALVNKSIPANELWAGIPARRLRQGVSWVHEHPCTTDQARAALA